MFVVKRVQNIFFIETLVGTLYDGKYKTVQNRLGKRSKFDLFLRMKIWRKWTFLEVRNNMISFFWKRSFFKRTKSYFGNIKAGPSSTEILSRSKIDLRWGSSFEPFHSWPPWACQGGVQRVRWHPLSWAVIEKYVRWYFLWKYVISKRLCLKLTSSCVCCKKRVQIFSLLRY